MKLIILIKPTKLTTQSKKCAIESLPILKALLEAKIIPFMIRILCAKLKY